MVYHPAQRHSSHQDAVLSTILHIMIQSRLTTNNHVLRYLATCPPGLPGTGRMQVGPGENCCDVTRIRHYRQFSVNVICRYYFVKNRKYLTSENNVSLIRRSGTENGSNYSLNITQNKTMLSINASSTDKAK